MKTKEKITEALLQWSSTSVRLSLYGFNQFTRTAGISMVQMTVMMYLYYQGSCEVTHFRDMLQITAAGASQMIERLVQMGIVQRMERPGDRRVRLVELTGHGREIIEQAIHARQAWIDQLVEKLSSKEGETIQAALAILNQRAGEIE